MREIVNILYNENYGNLRNEIKDLKDIDEDIFKLNSAIEGVSEYNSELLYMLLFLINEKYGTCNNIAKNLGHKTLYNKDNLLYLFELCNTLFDSHIPITNIAREQIADYEDIYGWDLDDKFLFPCNSSLYVLIAISRMMVSEKHIKEFKNEYERYKHIIENQIYVVNESAITNFYLSFIIDVNNEFSKNIFTGDVLSTKFINFNNKRVYKAAFGEPNVHTGIKKRSYNYIYHRYIEKCMTICRVVCFLTPSRWFQTDSGDLKYLIKFREAIKDSNKIRLINYYEIPNDKENTGGLSYLMIDNEYYGDCFFKKEDTYIDLSLSDIILKSALYYKLLDKLNQDDSMDSIFITNSWSGITTVDNRLITDGEDDNHVKVHVSNKYGKIKWVPKDSMNKIPIGLSMWKVFLPETISTGVGFNGKFILAKPYEICNETFCGFLINTKEQGMSLISYLKTEFASKIVLMRKIKNHINKHCLKYLPYIPLDREWSDKELVRYFELNSQEKQIIYG